MKRSNDASVALKRLTPRYRGRNASKFGVFITPKGKAKAKRHSKPSQRLYHRLRALSRSLKRRIRTLVRSRKRETGFLLC